MDNTETITVEISRLRCELGMSEGTVGVLRKHADVVSGDIATFHYDNLHYQKTWKCIIKRLEPAAGSPAVSSEAVPSYDGSAIWAKIHGELKPSPETLDAAVEEIICRVCKAHARKLITKRPPVFAPLSAYRLWTVDYHDDVSVSIGKPAFGRERAVIKYGW